MRLSTLSVVASLGAIIAVGVANADDHAEYVGDPYPLATCPVSGEPLGSMGDPIILIHDSREIRLCCNGCVGDFNENAETYLKEIDEAIIAQQLPMYPTTECIISDEPLVGEDASPINHVYGNRLVRFCCKMCRREFTNDPEAYLAELDALVIAEQADAYPMTECVISGDPLGSMDDSINMVYANRLVRFCCEGCIGEFETSPASYIARLDAARGMDTGAAPAGDHGHSHDGHEGHNH